MDETTQKDKEFGQSSPQAPLEKMFIDEYLKSKGFNSLRELCHLSDDEVKTIMIQACKYASLKLAEIESRAQFRREIHTE